MYVSYESFSPLSLLLQELCPHKNATFAKIDISKKTTNVSGDLWKKKNFSIIVHPGNSSKKLSDEFLIIRFNVELCPFKVSSWGQFFTFFGLKNSKMAFSENPKK